MILHGTTAPRLLLALALLGVGIPPGAAAPGGGGGGGGAPLSRRGWMQLLAEYTRAGDTAESGEWFPRPVPMTLTNGGGGAVPLLVVPVPVPTPHAAQCAAAAAPPPPAPPLGAVRLRAESAAPTPAPPDDEPSAPSLPGIVSSQQLVELFRAQVAASPELPPALLPDYTHLEDGDPAPAEGAPHAGARLVRLRRRFLPSARTKRQPREALGPEPLTPRFERSMLVRGEVTVPRAGYTEPYTVWWDAASGASRIDFHGGASSAYRMMLSDGRVQHVEVRLDRSGARTTRHCAVSTPRRAAPNDRTFPAFPDMQAFSFSGYVESEYGVVERWTQTVSGGGGELGGARGEALTFRHEVLVARAPDNYTTTPLRYSVAVDSSVLGADCDTYLHRYTELRDQHHPAHMLHIDLDESCEEVVSTDERMRVEPLREFLLPYRDRAYDALHATFKARHRRRYIDDTEDALRKNLVMQHMRFINSGNRQGATFSMEVNHLGDRLDAELSLLMGSREQPEGIPAEEFPHSREEVEAERPRLPRRFDWRQHGAVTPVRNQGSCSSCWAMAVTAAVEGALYVTTRRLVPLSDQCLVDCAHPYGGHGCGNSWPSSAYDYIKERGIPALDEYTPFQEKELECRESAVPPVTHISGHMNVTKYSVPALKVAIRRHGPAVVIIDTTPKSFLFYKKGVVSDERCAKNKPQHAVAAVGWGEHRGETYFILKNSWSAKWGDGGYVRVAARANTCGLLTWPSAPRLRTTDVRRVPHQ